MHKLPVEFFFYFQTNAFEVAVIQMIIFPLQIFCVFRVLVLIGTLNGNLDLVKKNNIYATPYPKMARSRSLNKLASCSTSSVCELMLKSPRMYVDDLSNSICIKKDASITQI